MNFGRSTRVHCTPQTHSWATYTSVTIPAQNRGQEGLLQKVVFEKSSQLLIGLKEVLQELITRQEAVAGGNGNRNTYNTHKTGMEMGSTTGIKLLHVCIQKAHVDVCGV